MHYTPLQGDIHSLLRCSNFLPVHVLFNVPKPVRSDLASYYTIFSWSTVRISFCDEVKWTCELFAVDPIMLVDVAISISPQGVLESIDCCLDPLD